MPIRLDGYRTVDVQVEPLCTGATLEDAKRLIFEPLSSPLPDTYGNIGSDVRHGLARFNGSPLIARIRQCASTAVVQTKPGEPTPFVIPRSSFGVWVVMVQANGVRIAQLRCVRCCTIARTIGERKVYADKPGPVVHDNRDDEPCERCGDVGVELHHWAPRHLFDDANDWPMGMLCRACHMEWHRIVTPNMARQGAA